MRIDGAGRLGVPAVVLAAVAACGSGEDARPAPVVEAALPSYEAPAGAPGFCAGLASLGALDGLALSVGTLAAGTDVEARVQVTQVIQQVREVLGDVRQAGGPAALEAALDDLAQALGAVVDAPPTGSAHGAVSAGLHEVDALAQPSCGFPR